MSGEIEAADKAALPSITPVITYPDFVPAHKTSRSIQKGLDLVQGIASTAIIAWSSARFLLQPMLQARDQARHEQYIRVQTHLETLNRKLSANLGLPYRPEISNLDSDTKAYFTQSIATQTTELPPSTSSVAAPAPLQQQTEAVAKVCDALQTLTCTAHEETALEDELLQFNTYLDSLMLVPGSTHRNQQRLWKQHDMHDAAHTLRQEIFAIKGVLLNARTFPGSRMAQVT